MVDVVAVSAPTEADGKTAQFDFGRHCLQQGGTYTYTVTEVVDDATANPGIAYDEDNVATVTVTVTDRDQEGNPTGQLVATAVVGKRHVHQRVRHGQRRLRRPGGPADCEEHDRARAGCRRLHVHADAGERRRQALFGSDPVTYQNVAATLGATEDAAT